MKKRIREIAKWIVILMLATYYGTGISIVSAQAIRGNPLAPITIVEFADFQCPDCARSKIIIDQVLEKYDGQVKLELKHRPLDRHPFAMPAARIFEALYRQDESKAWKFYDLVMVEQEVLKTGDTGLQYLVDKLDLTQAEQDQLSFDLTDPTINEGIKRNIDEESSLGFNGTPVFFINGVHLEKSASLDDFTRAIDQLQNE